MFRHPVRNEDTSEAVPEVEISEILAGIRLVEDDGTDTIAGNQLGDSLYAITWERVQAETKKDDTSIKLMASGCFACVFDSFDSRGRVSITGGGHNNQNKTKPNVL